MHVEKEKGDIGLLKVMADLSEKRYKIFLPVSEHLSFDLIAYKDRYYIRIQAKYRESKKGVIRIKAISSVRCSDGYHVTSFTEDDFDYFAVYCPDTNEVYYIPFYGLRKKDITLRIDEPKKNNKNINYAKDYKELL